MSSPNPATTVPHTTRELVNGTRLICTSRTPYATVIQRFRSLVPAMPAKPDRSSRAAFEAQVNSAIGPHSFALFHEFNHGAWITLFPDPNNPDPESATADKGPNGGRGLHRFIFGNPLIAINMIREDLESALNLPIEALFVETEEGCTRCVAQLPSGLVAGHDNARRNGKLFQMVSELDEKLLGLIGEVMA